MDEDRTNPLGAGDLRVLLHRLNNQLAVILANAELLEAHSPDSRQRVRAAEIVSAALQAMTVTRSIGDTLDRG
jgi:hypothetical protein